MVRVIRALVTPSELAVCGELPGVVDVRADDGREWRTVSVSQLAELANEEGLELFDVYGRRMKLIARYLQLLRRKAAAVLHAGMQLLVASDTTSRSLSTRPLPTREAHPIDGLSLVIGLATHRKPDKDTPLSAPSSAAAHAAAPLSSSSRPTRGV
jgi:hypothetical protein